MDQFPDLDSAAAEPVKKATAPVLGFVDSDEENEKQQKKMQEMQAR